jgi:hypothetical protein
MDQRCESKIDNGMGDGRFCVRQAGELIPLIDITGTQMFANGVIRGRHGQSLQLSEVNPSEVMTSDGL